MAGTAGRVAYLDGIRAVAIGAVLALHWLSWYSPLFHGGSVGVDVFFVLSGFIITTMLWRTPATGPWWRAWAAFVRRRVLRLYPALLGLVLVSVLLVTVLPSTGIAPTEVVRRGALTLAQTSSFWAAGQDGGLWVTGLQPFGQTWSLAVEWYFYLLWPLAVLAARRRGWAAQRLAAVSLVAAVVLYLAALPLPTLWFYFGPAARFAEILVGAALALWFSAGTAWPARLAAPLSAAALAAVALYTLVGRDGDTALYRYVGLPVTVAAAVVLIAAGYGGPAGAAGPVHRLLAHPVIAAVGRHSYSLYLWHLVPLLLLADVTGVPKPVLGALAAGSTAVLTALSYRLLERPFLRPRSDVLRPGALPSSRIRLLRTRPENPALGQRGDEVLG